MGTMSPKLLCMAIAELMLTILTTHEPEKSHASSSHGKSQFSKRRKIYNSSRQVHRHVPGATHAVRPPAVPQSASVVCSVQNSCLRVCLDFPSLQPLRSF